MLCFSWQFGAKALILVHFTIHRLMIFAVSWNRLIKQQGIRLEGKQDDRSLSTIKVKFSCFCWLPARPWLYCWHDSTLASDEKYVWFDINQIWPIPKDASQWNSTAERVERWIWCSNYAFNLNCYVILFSHFYWNAENKNRKWGMPHHWWCHWKGGKAWITNSLDVDEEKSKRLPSLLGLQRPDIHRQGLVVAFLAFSYTWIYQLPFPLTSFALKTVNQS